MDLRVAVIEDDARFRRSLETLFSHSPGFALAGSYGSAEPAVAVAEKAAREGRRPPWDLALLDIELPGMNGIEATRRLELVSPGTPTVMLTVFEEPRTILQAICAGADGYLLKRTRAGELLASLRAIAEGGAPLTAGVARTVLGLLRSVEPAPAETAGDTHRPGKLDLTPREQEVLRALVRGLAYKQVADELEVSLDTVRAHIRAVYRKLQVHSVAEAVVRAIREQLV